jgi:carbon starvation protein CstA
MSEGGKKETPECEANASVILHITGLSQPRQYLSKYLLVIDHLILVVRVCYICPLATTPRLCSQFRENMPFWAIWRSGG